MAQLIGSAKVLAVLDDELTPLAVRDGARALLNGDGRRMLEMDPDVTRDQMQIGGLKALRHVAAHTSSAVALSILNSGASPRFILETLTRLSVVGHDAP